MLFLKCLKKIIVFPVVVMIGFLWLITKILVSLYGVAHGMLVLLILIFCIAEIVIYRDILQACVLGIVAIFSFLVLSAGTFVEIVLAMTIRKLWNI